MTMMLLMTMLIGATIGFGAAAVLLNSRLLTPPPELMRTNVNGRRVPAVLGFPVTLGGSAALVTTVTAGPLGWEPARLGRVGVSVAIVCGLMFAAGVWDDRRGDEASRGFKGHLRALAHGRVTSGALKIAAGGAAGLAAALMLMSHDVLRAAAAILLVAGGANMINLFDRAPGRAGKLVLLIALPLMALGHPGWALGAAGFLGALIACLPADLGERAMLGDAGANPLGALVGLGLALSLDGWAVWVAAVVVVSLNVASERWSFSKVIADHPWLDSLDRAGRK